MHRDHQILILLKKTSFALNEKEILYHFFLVLWFTSR